MNRLKQENLESKCCGAKVRVVGFGDFEDEDEPGTRYFECCKCKKACNFSVPLNVELGINHDGVLISTGDGEKI